MSAYNRSTRACVVSQLTPELSKAIVEYFQNHQLGDPTTEVLSCCETISTKRNLGKLVDLLEGNPDTTSHLALLLTADWFIWARSGDQSQTTVTGARFKMIRVKAFVSRRTKDMQLEVAGFVNDTKESVRGNLQMGPDLAAQKFCDAIGEAVDKANPPVKRKFFGLTGN